ncbi:hypothetical protein MPTK1_4g21480 [Marchantia polymorpha subsp. ruderalis]|uniref:Uncharacterized protein n=2 Tax=Marchantia polymorpha TaxID=3197 RepID=A0AAF6BCB3_MARPO|nr:hypothetical protein MARPO_0090s0073 [Marchantia polymorpha]BBN09647.1 hypothetical protein Mp_4g21480 [Marchantia polymorpha subsp. ruderalis]|eukprot:PTQ33339.1 hypothetical protein MARPO_0090s0073 [Marchantia polymorpha]
MASAVCASSAHCCARTCSSSDTVSRSASRSRPTSSLLFPPAGKLSAGKCSISSRSRRSCGGVHVVRMGLRAVESYDASFQLLPECEERLRDLLKSETFCAQVAEQAQKGPDVKYVFSGELFQPVPWSPTTKHGMPQEYEKYLEDKEQYAIINVPPNFMFQAKIFKPSRLCAVYQRLGVDQ